MISVMALHEMDPTSRFTDRAAAYRRCRPDYPATLFDVLLEGDPPVIADVGAGTGISSLQIAERGPVVLAVEPNDAMRAEGVRHPRIEWIDGTAEATGLPDASVDLVASFQSFHWFDPDRAIEEFLRIVRPGGSIAAVWNERDVSDPFTDAYGALVRRISGNHPAEARESSATALYDSPRLANVRRHPFSHQQELDLAGLIGRAESTSYLPSQGPLHEELIEELRTLFATWNEHGFVRLQYVTSLYLVSGRS